MNRIFYLNFALKVLTLTILAICFVRLALAKEVLAPEKFSGPISAGYRAAQKSKDICSKLFCYCGCDMTDEHTSLLDCFTSMHGVDCAICQEEALIAYKLKEQGKSLAQIQRAIDERFAAQYPWDEASPMYENYVKNLKISSKNVLNNKPINTIYSTKTKNGKTIKASHCCGH